MTAEDFKFQVGDQVRPSSYPEGPAQIVTYRYRNAGGNWYVRTVDPGGILNPGDESPIGEYSLTKVEPKFEVGKKYKCGGCVFTVVDKREHRVIGWENTGSGDQHWYSYDSYRRNYTEVPE